MQPLSTKFTEDLWAADILQIHRDGATALGYFDSVSGVPIICGVQTRVASDDRTIRPNRDRTKFLCFRVLNWYDSNWRER